MVVLPRRRLLHLRRGRRRTPGHPGPRAGARLSHAASAPRGWLTRPAGRTDTLARLIAPWLSERLGQPFIIENRPGAGNNIATEAVVRSPADGHTLLVADAANAINATLYEKLNFNFARDIAPVAGLIGIPLVMTASIRRSLLAPFLNSSNTPRQTRAKSAWRRQATDTHAMCPANCSRPWPA